MDDIKEADGFDTIVFDRVQTEKIKESHMAQSYMPLTEYVANNAKDKQKERHYRGFGFGKKEKRVTSCEGDYGKDECEVANACYDMVNKPRHYCDGKLETIQKIEAVIEGLPAKEASCLANVLKYFDRAGLKDAAEQDLDKANNYAHRLVYGSWRHEH